MHISFAAKRTALCRRTTDVLAIAAVTVAAVASAAGDGGQEYLNDLAGRMESAQDWGQLGLNVASYAPGQTAAEIRIGDKAYAKGLGHAPGWIEVDLDGVYERFEAEVGVQAGAGAPGSVVFQVLVDGSMRFQSGVMRMQDPAMLVSVDVRDAQTLRLVVTDAGDGITCDQANWANARLIRTGAADPSPHAPRIDMGQFARIATWDPNSRGGPRWSRAKEFPAEDLFLETDVSPDADGCYVVPVANDGHGCLGLQWLERRRIRQLIVGFADEESVPCPDAFKVEYWAEDRSGYSGASVWQGKWADVRTTVRRSGNEYLVEPMWELDPARSGVWKVRFVFASSPQPIRIRRLSAFTSSSCDIAEIVLRSEASPGARSGTIEVYNGTIIAPQGSTTALPWQLETPLRLKVLYTKPRLRKGDRTVIRVQLAEGAFGIAVDDILARGCVYQRDFGVFATTWPEKISLAEYQQSIAAKKTLLEEVRQRPDQTFAEALAKIHRPIQDAGPVLLSLAGDNHKLHVDRDGTVRFRKEAETAVCLASPVPYPCEIRPEFGEGQQEVSSRELYGGWLPAPITRVEDEGVAYSQCTFVTPYGTGPTFIGSPWLSRRPLGVIAFTVENMRPTEAAMSLKLVLRLDAGKDVPGHLRQIASRIVLEDAGRLLAAVDTSQCPLLKAELAANVLMMRAVLPAGSKQQCFVYLPQWSVKPEDHAELQGGDTLLSDFRSYWDRVMAPAMKLEIPDAQLQRLILASQAHCMISTRNEAEGLRLALWDGDVVYGPLEGDSNYGILGLDLLGHDEFARRCNDFFVQQYNQEGFLTMGYTTMGTGWHLWTLAQHYDLTKDRQWFAQIAPEVARVCHWIVRQREKTKRLDPRGERIPEYGLMPPGVEADWNAMAYYFCLNGYFYAGLDGASRVLGESGHPDALLFQQHARELKEEILRAFHRTQSLSPVLPLRDGTWVPAYPSQIHCPGLTSGFYPGEDGNRSWCYDVEEGAPHLVPQGILDAKSRDATWMLNHLEDVQFLEEGWLFYPAKESQQDPFNLGGFSKVQPYLTRTAQMYALRDDVRPFVRAYFNAVASVVNLQTLTCSEHFAGTGASTNSESMGHFLEQTRWMLLMESGEELWLAPFVTNNWLKDGMVVSVRNAPTRFGKVSYRICSSVAQGFVTIVIEPPDRNPPGTLVVRVRHPDGKRMTSVTVNGTPHTSFDATTEIVRLPPSAQPITVIVRY